MQNVLTLVLAGGKGSRLEPLTLDRSKPSVPFGGIYRIIDFVLSNCINSGLRRILVLTQYKGASLDRHINLGWHFLCRELNEFIDVLPPQQRVGEHWYRGTADAVYQNIYTIEQSAPQYILILSGDHIYRMDYSSFLQDLIEADADCSIACLPVGLEEGRAFGVMGIDENRWVRRFEEKPDAPFPIPGDPDRCLASMGIYAFKSSFLFDELCRDAAIPKSSHDFGKDLIPHMIQSSQVRAYPVRNEDGDGPMYWRDVGTLESYYQASMDLVSVEPQLNLYDSTWPIRGYHPPVPPPKFVFADHDAEPKRVGHAMDSLVGPGSIISGGEVTHSVISQSVRINSYATVVNSILFEGVQVGRSAQISNAIIDKNVSIPNDMTIGIDPEQDRRNGLTTTDCGITVVPKGHQFR
ncbi:Glucose-1-phosphate adenylyltransferase [Thalassoglobus neptunius]|uniref:Glucose-1-phosphate adenylyltransferase n=1 Tax=Thalassoglobus neptunius TaxID=1938619 RepID=A0A5C5WGV6_9PLAN|nr:glucose-1-phosphate adenylyltransferase [Thalassoglobus neptunius]TWT50008.1 Glucose-1-phosphate adenylyltransferase [Thalassoglobus neptunius]